MNEAMKELKIAHFNDVYKVSDQLLPNDPSGKAINVPKFATMLSEIRERWKASGHGDGLTTFSGDIFSPSPHSTLTSGRHMAAIANALRIDISVVGNHEFDFGVRQLRKLIEETKFPWLLSNVVDSTTGVVPEPLKELHVLQCSGVRIGVIGLVEKDWLATVLGWPDNFLWKSMTEIGMKLSQILRDPLGPHKCDIVIALTHSRVPNDIILARELFALSPKAQATTDITSQHGVDLILGGHDHFYWISNGVTSWKGYDLESKLPDAEDDRGDVLVIKSGTDFQDLSEITVKLKAARPGSVRRMIIDSVDGIRHITHGALADNGNMSQVIKKALEEIKFPLTDPICFTEVDLPPVLRTGESVLANWIADCLKPVYDDVLLKMKHDPVDGVILCTGSIRAGNFRKGPLTLGDLMEIVPYPDPMIVLEMDGNALWTALESGLSMWPKSEGRFPAISGFRLTWTSSNDPQSRVQGIWLQGEPKTGPDGKLKPVDKEEIRRSSDRKYTIAVADYMAQGGDGYEILKSQKVILGEENGQSKSALIKTFLQGAHFVNKVAHNPEIKLTDLQPETYSCISNARAALKLPALDPSSLQVATPGISSSSLFSQVTSALSDRGRFNDGGEIQSASHLELAESIQKSVVDFKWMTSPKLVRFAMKVAQFEDMSVVDPYERRRRDIAIEGTPARVLTYVDKGGDFLGVMSNNMSPYSGPKEQEVLVEKDLPRISPVIDGRLRNLSTEA